MPDTATTLAGYLREQASELRALAHKNPDPHLSRELETLATHCEKLANEMTGNGHAHHGDEARE